MPIYLQCQLTGRCKCFFVYTNIKAEHISVSPERRNPNLQLLTLPEAAALLLASLEKPQKAAGAVASLYSGLRTLHTDFFLHKPTEILIQ